MNYQMYLLYNQLMDAIANSGLPVGAAYYIIKNISDRLQQTFLQVAEQESKQNQGKPTKFENTFVPNAEEKVNQGEVV